MALAWLAAIPVGSAVTANAADSSAARETDGCVPGEGLRFICGPVASEDLQRIPGTGWLIVSGMNVGTPAHLYLIESHTKRAISAYPLTDEPAPPASTMGCSGPPDAQRMSLDGLALRPGPRGTHTLYAANHGDRMAIEVFTVDSRGRLPQLHWRDCAVLPEKTLPNAVAALPDGGFAVISFYDPTDPQAWSHMAAGKMTGRVLRWTPGHGFTEVPGSATSGGNGLETSPDGRLLYESSWSARRIVVLSLRDQARREIPLDFMPDNIHRLADGSLLVGGQRTSVEAVQGCGPQCPQPWVIARIEPRTGAVQILVTGAGTLAINYACGAVALDDTLFITARGDRRIAYRHFPKVADLR